MGHTGRRGWDSRCATYGSCTRTGRTRRTDSLTCGSHATGRRPAASRRRLPRRGLLPSSWPTSSKWRCPTPGSSFSRSRQKRVASSRPAHYKGGGRPRVWPLPAVEASGGRRTSSPRTDRGRPLSRARAARTYIGTASARRRHGAPRGRCGADCRAEHVAGQSGGVPRGRASATGRQPRHRAAEAVAQSRDRHAPDPRCLLVAASSLPLHSVSRIVCPHKAAATRARGWCVDLLCAVRTAAIAF